MSLWDQYRAFIDGSSVLGKGPEHIRHLWAFLVSGEGGVGCPSFVSSRLGGRSESRDITFNLYHVVLEVKC